IVNIDQFGSFRAAVPAVAGAVVGMLPAGMFLLTSVALAVGVINLAKSNTLVQELYCIEMLARVDVLCLDKTGTITDGSMKVCDVVEVKNPSDYTIREIVASMLFALKDNNQTAIALGNHFDRVQILKATQVLPFSSQRKLSAVSFEKEGTYILGAPEFVLKEAFEKVDEKINRFVSQGYRVLILARAPGAIKNNAIPDGVKPIAIITIRDHVRAEAPNTIAWFRNNGVDVKVISGDNPITVSEVAKRAGIEGADRYISLDGMSNNEVRDAVSKYNIFGRVTPEQKLIIIKELKHLGKTVAMTGDGVNDILALREADCSIAMAAGSEAARNVSHLVLLDSNFASMPKVVNEGRRVVNNVQKTSSLFLTKTLFIMMLAIFTVSLGIKFMLEPRQLLLLEMFVIGIPSFVLALELNNQIIKGRFLANVLKNAFSGALVMFLSIASVYILWQFDILSLTDTTFTTMAIYITTIVGLLVLLKVASPLNIYRGILLCVMISLITLALIYFSWFFGMKALGLVEALILIIIIQLSFPVMSQLNKALASIRLGKFDDIIEKAEDEPVKEEVLKENAYL
ncbi:MAG: HAD-IC family P-type ATPase, partial [Firmicutes bacterium]|nr:HAD-IC family P-type ATPase [Bacillota bacterium]